MSAESDCCGELQRELDSAREALSGFLERVPLGVHHWTLGAGGELVFAGANAEAGRMLAIDHGGLVGRTMEEAFPGNTGTPIPDAYRRVILDGVPYEDEQVTYKDDRISGAFEIHAFRTAPGRMAVLFRDITERRRAEAEIREKTEELDRYFTTCQDLLCISGTDGRFRRLNPEWVRTLGWPIEELLGRPYLELVHPEDREGTVAAIASLSSQQVVLDFRNRYRCRDGSYRWLEWRSYPQGSLIYSSARDVTAVATAEAARRQGERRLDSIFRAAPIGIGVVVNRVITDANERLCAMTGYGREELVGKSARLLYPDDAEYERVGREKYEQIAQTGTGTVETRWVRKDGLLITLILSSTPLDPADQGAGVTFTAMDITERRSLEARMQQAQKLESLGVLAGGIAHDFNNILMAVLGNADLALGQLSPGTAARVSVEEIDRAARRAADLCRQLLAYSGKGRFVVQSLDLNEVLREMEPMLQSSVSKKTHLRLDLGKLLPPIEADVAQIRQVVMNLVINASEALGEGAGVVRVTTGAIEVDARPRGPASLTGELPPGRYLCLEVTDTGCGMNEETRQRIFDPFFTTKFAGRGLGLAAALGIVRGHHGALEVTSEPGKGSTFRILFPATGDPATRLEPPARDSDGWKGEGTVLLVDDEPAIRAVGARMLERLGFRVLTAADGVAAVDLFRRSPQTIDCIIMDLTMPNLDGEEAYRILRGIRPEIRVLLSSGYNEQDAVQRFVGQGLAGFIQKPYQMTLLAQKLRQVMEGGFPTASSPAAAGDPRP